MLGVIGQRVLQSLLDLLWVTIRDQRLAQYYTGSVVEQHRCAVGHFQHYVVRAAGMATNPQTGSCGPAEWNAAIHLLKGFDEQPFLHG